MVRYEWDEAKNKANLKKHGITFEFAIGVFEDPHNVSVPDLFDDEERLWTTAC